MHPINLGLGLALLLHVAAGMSPEAEAQLAAFRAQLEAKEAQQAGIGAAKAQGNPKEAKPIMQIMPGQLPGAAAAGNLPTSTQDSMLSSTTDDGLSSSTTTAFVDTPVSSTRSAQPEPQTDSKVHKYTF